jgi:hypothetical protein
MDVVVTVAMSAWVGWLAEGALPGEPSPESWALFYGSGAGSRKPVPPKDLQPGDRVYVAAFGFVRGYSPLLRIAPTENGYALVRGGGAVAVTPWAEHGPLHVPGFQGVRYRSWRREAERPFDDWMTVGMPANVRAHVERLQRLRQHLPTREEMARRALITGQPQRIFQGLAEVKPGA